MIETEVLMYRNIRKKDWVCWCFAAYQFLQDYLMPNPIYKLSDHGQERPKGSLFNNYYTEE